MTTNQKITTTESTASRHKRRLEKDMGGSWPKFLAPADMALDMADQWEVKK